VEKLLICLQPTHYPTNKVLFAEEETAVPEIVQLHFLLLAAGEVLKVKKTVNPQDIQDYIQQDEAFGVRPELNNCRLALHLLEDSGFIKRVPAFDDLYNDTYTHV
jgi:predicted ribonuclease YlaK